MYDLVVVLLDEKPVRVIEPEDTGIIPLIDLGVGDVARAYRESYIAYGAFVSMERMGRLRINLNLDDISDAEYVADVVERVGKNAVALSLIRGKYVVYALLDSGFATAVWPGRRFPGTVFLDVEGEDGGEFSDFVVLTDADLITLSREVTEKLREAAKNGYVEGRQYLIIMLDKDPDGGRRIVNAVKVPKNKGAEEAVRELLRSHEA